ncbi:MAG: TetR/AcrR family transcriptional regulator [Verrucomicrobia bacterium]|jgi:AcrR family transcriptional regulator|nr:TetR/AcrR family transcriptional regulator [Verrucomicrobiota bacterium]
MTDTDTKTAILDAAENLFVEQGFEGASLRSVTAMAKVNIAAIHYHFGSKDALVQAVLERRLSPVNQERLERLDALEAISDQSTLVLEDILRALFEPALRMSGIGGGGNKNIARLIGRIFSEPSNSLQLFLKERFQIVFERFTAALRSVLPELPEVDFFWRVHFMMGAMCHTLCDQERPKLLSGGLCDPHCFEETSDQLVIFVAGGLRAQCTNVRERGAS